MNQHHAVVGEIKNAMNKIVEQSHEYHPPQKRLPVHKETKIREFKVVGDEPPRMQRKVNMSYCPVPQTSAKADVQVTYILHLR